MVFQVTLFPSRVTFPAHDQQTLLQAAQAAGLTLPSACRNGSCRACMSRCLEGQIQHLIDWPSLSADEKNRGMVLPCVACAKSDVVLRAPSSPWQGVEED